MNLRIKGGRSCFYQWDSGQTVIVEHEGTIHEVHFAHKDDERSLTVITKEIENGVEANVPNILLQSSEDIFAYLVFRDEDGTETRKAVRIPVLSRPKPETYVYTESEVLNYAYLDERLKELEGEGLANAVADYLEKNPPQAGATEEEKKQIQQNKTDIEQLAQDKLDADKLPDAVREYLEENPVTGGGFIASDVPPEDTSVLWVDTDDNEADNLQAAIDEALAQAKASGEFKGEPGQPGADGKDYVLTEADKQEIAELTAPLVDVPEGGGSSGGGSGFSLPLLYETTTTEEARWIDTGDNAFEAKNMIIVELMSKATATNEADYNAAGSIYTENEKPIYPWSNYVLGTFNAIVNEFVAPMSNQYDTLLRCFGFRGNGGDWTVYYNCRNVVNDRASYASIKIPYRAGLRYPITGIIIGDQSAAAGTRVFGVGTTLKVWGC